MQDFRGLRAETMRAFRTVGDKARQLIKDQQMEVVVINLINAHLRPNIGAQPRTVH